MSILTIATPPFTSIEEFKRLMTAVGPEPDGLEARYVVRNENGYRVVAVWQSREHLEAFRGRLATAITATFGEPSGQPLMEAFEVLDAHVPSGQPA